MPKTTPNRKIESVINFSPTVDHQIRKNGFRVLKIIPNMIGHLLLLVILKIICIDLSGRDLLISRSIVTYIDNAI